LEISLDRGRIDRYAAAMLVVHAVVAAGLLVGAHWLFSAFVPEPGVVAILLGLVLVWLGWSGLYVSAWVKTRRIDVPMELQPTGLVARSPYGELVIPWDTITSARIERTWVGRRLRLRLVPTSDPRHADITVAWLRPEMMRVVEKHGVRYSMRVLDIEADQLREAFELRSGGRVRIG
jgi:hypothetical protein